MYRYNRLLNVIINSLHDLLKALKGLVVMSQQLEEMANSIFVNQLPTLWAGKVRLSTGISVSRKYISLRLLEVLRSASASTSRLRRSFIGRCLALADDWRFVADARERRLRSTASRTCAVTRTYSTFDDRAGVQLLDLDYGTVFHRT